MKNDRKEKGVVTDADLAEVINRFLAERHWKPGQERVSLKDMHLDLVAWLAKNGVPFTVHQRKFYRLLVDKGFRAAYLNVKSDKGWSFRKVIFADRTAGGSSETGA